MLYLGLDLSKKPGYALLQDEQGHPELLAYGIVRLPEELDGHEKFGKYPYSYVDLSANVAVRLMDKIKELEKIHGQIDRIIIEETTASKQNYSQKTLEFIHQDVLGFIESDLADGWNRKDHVYYIRDSIWKSLTGARLNNEEKRNNSRIYRAKKATGKKVIRKIKGESVRKVTKYDAYIRRANELYGLDLKRKDEDAAAAILVATAFIMGAPTCDGTTEGGLMPKKDVNNG